MMRKLGFNEIRIARIMTCVNIVSYSILINGQPGSIIKLFGGLHQRDLISPYLYLICAEGLSSLLNDVEFSHKIKGVKVAKNNLTISHLFFY